MTATCEALCSKSRQESQVVEKWMGLLPTTSEELLAKQTLCSAAHRKSSNTTTNAGSEIQTLTAELLIGINRSRKVFIKY